MTDLTGEFLWHDERTIVAAPKWWKRLIRFITLGWWHIPAVIRGDVHGDDRMLLVRSGDKVKLIGDAYGGSVRSAIVIESRGTLTTVGNLYGHESSGIRVTP